MQKILVVDDAEMNRELLREILETDYEVEMAGNGEQALQSFGNVRMRRQRFCWTCICRM